MRVSKGGNQTYCCSPFETPRYARLLRVRSIGELPSDLMGHRRRRDRSHAFVGGGRP
jgi:hypothetical protein